MNTNLQVNYRLLAAQAETLMSGQSNRIANAANLGALLYQELPDVNWAGVYSLAGDVLLLGPFQGRPACVEIPLEQGVCGTAALTGEVQRVANVHDFESHIACDAASESELVIPLIRDGEMIGVLDIDSPHPDRFSEADEAGILRISEIFLDSIS